MHWPLATGRLQTYLRNTQTGLEAKELASEQLRLQFYCSRTSEVFLSLFFKGLAAWFTV
jgi:hypothetical protein